jgi:arylsulfatase A-like enzyme
VRGVALLVLALLAPAASGQTDRSAPPNVVLIITDDVGYGDLGVYGAPDVRTPNIDGLARAGVRMTSFYANGPLCSPTRAGLITGRYQQRSGLEVPLGTPDERGLTASGRSLPQLLRNAGYATALIGKWHLGYKPQQSPNAHGFDYFFGFKSGYIDYYQHTGGDGRPDLFENESPTSVDGYMTDLITQRSVQFIRRSAERPFFLEVAYNATHWPYQAPDHPTAARGNARHLFAYDEAAGTRADYVAMLERVDDGVGAILAALGELDLASRTLVVFTNDNGGEWLSRNDPLTNRKFTLWEGGIRVPAILRWPGRLPAGRVSDQVGITMDLTASILALARAQLPSDLRLDGIDLVALLEGSSPAVERQLFWRTNTGGRNQKAVRVGDWKLLLDGNSPFLFDVRTDVGERTDLGARQPEVARRLKGLLDEWERGVDAEGRASGGAAGG